MVNIKISNRLLYTFIAIILVVTIIGVVYAYGTANPPIMGHSYQEVELPASGAVWPGLNAFSLQNYLPGDLISEAQVERQDYTTNKRTTTFLSGVDSKRYVFRVRNDGSAHPNIDSIAIPNEVILELCSIGSRGTDPTKADDGCEIRLFHDNGYGIDSPAGTYPASAWKSSSNAGLLAVQQSGSKTLWRSRDYSSGAGAYGQNNDGSFSPVLSTSNGDYSYCTFHDGENNPGNSNGVPSRPDSSSSWTLEVNGWGSECWLVIID